MTAPLPLACAMHLANKYITTGISHFCVCANAITQEKTSDANIYFMSALLVLTAGDGKREPIPVERVNEIVKKWNGGEEPTTSPEDILALCCMLSHPDLMEFAMPKARDLLIKEVLGADARELCDSIVANSYFITRLDEINATLPEYARSIAQ